MSVCEIVAKLARCGLSHSSAGEILSEKRLGRLNAMAVCFVASQKVFNARAAFARGFQRDDRKQFLVKYRDDARIHDRDDLYLAGLDLLPIVTQAYGERMQYYASDLWYVMPNGQARPREWSQNWHRDPESEVVVKVMLYFSDVDSEAGPLQYVCGSAGNFLDVVPAMSYAPFPAGTDIDPSMVTTLEVPATTIVFVNTSGLHRGGYTRSKPRISAVWTFVKVDAT